MKAIYNDNLTIETRDDASERNLRECWAMQEAVEGKALVIGGGINPIKQNDPLHDGVSLWLAEDPTENAEIKLDIIPAMMDGFPIVKINCAPACPDDEEEAPSAPTDEVGQPAPNVAPCSVDILGISLGEEGLLIIPREVRMQCEPLVNAANALMNALNDLPVNTVDKNAIAMLAADLMAQAEQEGVKNGVEAYTDFTHDMTPEKFAELVKSVKGDSMPS